jgi:hypothetical protein
VIGSAAAYIWVTLALYSYAARRFEALVFGVVAVATVLGTVRLAIAHAVANPVGDQDPARVLGKLGRRVTVAGVGVLITAAQLWYSSVYLPANLDVGIAFTASVGKAAAVSPTTRLVPVSITVQDDSSVTAVALTSIYTVTGLRYPPASRLRSRSDTLARALTVGQGLESEQGLNVGLTGRPSERLLAIGRVAGDGRLLFPNVLNANEVVVAVPREVKALEVRVSLDYARQTRLQLAGIDPTTGLARPSIGPYVTAVPACAEDVVEARRLRQSLLQRLTRGDEVVETNWCAQPHQERTFSFISGGPSDGGSGPTAAGLRFVLHARPHSGGAYGLLHTQRVWTFPLG